MTDKRTYRTTVTFDFDSENEERDFAIRRAMPDKLSSLCKAIQPVGWEWERETDDDMIEGGLG